MFCLLQKNFHLVFFLFRTTTKRKGLAFALFPNLLAQAAFALCNQFLHLLVFEVDVGFQLLGLLLQKLLHWFFALFLCLMHHRNFLSAFYILQISQFVSLLYQPQRGMTMQKTWKKPRLFLGQTGQNKLMGLIPQNSAVFQIFNKSVLTVTVAFNILRKAQGKLLF